LNLHRSNLYISGGSFLGKAFWRYFIAQGISLLGSYIGKFALIFAVYALTGSVVAMGTMALVGAIPENLLRLFGAPLIDRFPRLKLMATLDISRCAIYLIPWVIWQTGHPSIWLLYLLSFVGGAANALYGPAAMAIIPSLVPLERLPKANALIDTVYRTLGIGGPVIGTAVAVFMGTANALLLDGISFGICGLVLVTTTGVALTSQVNRRKGLSGYGAELVEGFAIYRQIPALLSITAVLAVSNIGSMGSFTMLLPLVRDRLGAQNNLFGWSETGLAVGLLAASLFASTFTLRIRRRYLMLGGLLLIQIAQIIAARLTPSLAIFLVVALATMGFGSATYSIHSNTIYQQLVPDRLRGRIMSVRMLVAFGLQPVGQFFGTVIAARWGPQMTFLVGGGIPLVVTLCAFFLPSLRGLDALGAGGADQATNSPPAQQGAPAAAANSSQ
jgi:MFS family permease